MSPTRKKRSPRRRPRVVLVSPSRLYSDGWSTAAEIGRNNPALELLRGALNDDADVDILDLPNRVGVPESDAQRAAFLERTRELVDGADWNDALVGISCWSSLHYLSTLEVARMVKRRTPGARIVVGGYHPSAVPGDFLEHPDLFDHVVIGPGEQPMRDLLAGSTERVLKAPPSRGTPGELLTQAPPEKPVDVYYVYLSRGCPFACAYCVESVMTARRWRALEPAEAARLVLSIDRSGNAKRIAICDPCFGANPTWRREFLRRLVRGRLRTPAWAEARADSFTEEDARLLGRLPFQVDLGVDSASESMLRAMRKTTDPRRYLERTVETCRLLDEYRVPCSLYFIMNHPGETDHTIRETVTWLSSLRATLRNDTAKFVVGTYFFVPGTAVDHELSSFREQFGTVIHEPRWWTRQEPHYPLATRISATTGQRGSEIHAAHWRRQLGRILEPQGAWRFVR